MPALLATLLLDALAGAAFGLLVIVIVVQRNHLRRFERFRAETIDVMGNFSDNVVNINERLTAAGYPPGRVLPVMKTPVTPPVHVVGRPR